MNEHADLDGLGALVTVQPRDGRAVAEHWPGPRRSPPPPPQIPPVFAADGGRTAV